VSEPNNRNNLSKSVDLRRSREEHWRHTGERPVWRNLSLIGALGWLIVAPILLGALLGHWLDQRLGGHVFWTVSLIFAGAALGFYLAWRRIEREQ
jgi:ATP synthase protein I